jgi:predicted N-acetyltransferase YhbS
MNKRGYEKLNKMTTKTGLEINIRQETPKDHTEVNELVYRAFAAKGHFDTADYLKEVRKKDTFVPELSFVAALENGKIVGQITLYKTDVITDKGRITQLVLSPISVLPEFFNNGIAREMITFALGKAKEMGYAAVFLQGNPNFYKKFGFEPTYKYKIYHEIDKERNADYCMVNILLSGALDGISGLTYYN